MQRIPSANSASLPELEVAALKAFGAKRYSKAETALRLWLKGAVEAGEDDLSVARVVHLLAQACEHRRKYEESYGLHQEALLRYERWYRATSNARHARLPTSRRARLFERAGFAHFTGAVLTGRAAALQALGRTEEASRDLALAYRRLKRAQHLEEVDLGRSDTIASMSLLMDLARVCLARGRSTEAGPFLNRVLAITDAEIAQPPERFTNSQRASFRRNLHHQAALVRRMLADPEQV